jgi:xylan 1,4-beta-xylosidase
VADNRAWPDVGGWRTLRDLDRLEELEPARSIHPREKTIDLGIELPMPAVSLIELDPQYAA